MLRARDSHPALDEMDRKPADAPQKRASSGLTPFVPAEPPPLLSCCFTGGRGSEAGAGRGGVTRGAASGVRSSLCPGGFRGLTHLLETSPARPAAALGGRKVEGFSELQNSSF